MLADIFNTPAIVSINGKEYKAEFDFKSYAILETLTGKGFFKLFDLLMVQNNLTLNDSIEIICCAFIKHHTEEEVTSIREYLIKNLYLIKELNEKVIMAFVLPCLPPEILTTVEDVKKKTKKRLEKKKV